MIQSHFYKDMFGLIKRLWCEGCRSRVAGGGDGNVIKASFMQTYRLQVNSIDYSLIHASGLYTVTSKEDMLRP